MSRISRLLGVLVVAAAAAASHVVRAAALPPVSDPYVHVSAANPAYLELAGKPFIPVGFNDQTSWGNLSWLYDAASPSITEDYFKTLHADGINTLRIMLSYNQDPKRYLFQDPLGRPRPEMVAMWDEIFALAKKYNVYILLTPWDPFWMQREWSASPWNQANGGPCKDMGCFFTDPAAIAAEKALYAFLIDRYGTSTQLLAWELINEADLWFKGGMTDHQTAAALKRWVQTMSTYVSATELARWGRRHLVTISTAAAQPSAPWDFLYRDPYLDFFTSHFYYDAIGAPADPNTPAQTASLGVFYQTFALRGQKPFLDSEDGPINHWPLPRDFDVRYFHNMSWAELLSGAAGPGLRWPYTPSGILGPAYYDSLRALGAFAAAFPWLDDHFAPTSNTNPQLAGDGAAYVQTYGLAGDHSAALWLLNTAATQTRSLTLDLSGLKSEPYRVEIWDPWQGDVISTQHTESSGTVHLTLPAFTTDLALTVVHESAAPGALEALPHD